MPLSQLRNVNFGRLKLNATGTSGVGYQLLDETGAIEAVRTTVGVYQTAPGIYAAYISFPDNFRGQILWDTGTAFAVTYHATEAYNVEENDPKVALSYDILLGLTGSIDSISSGTQQISSSVSSISGTLSTMESTLNLTYGTVLDISSSVSIIGDQVFDISGSMGVVISEVQNLSSSIVTLSNDLSSSLVVINDAALLISSSAEIISGSAALLSGAVGSLSGLSGTLDAIESKVDRLVDIQFGRWHIIGNQMVFYKEDNATEVARFDLFDDGGNPTMDAVFERVKV